MKKITALILLITFLISFNTYADVYIAEKGDTLSEILYYQNIEPIYGKNGYLKKLLELNPNLKGGDNIAPGTKIILPDFKLASTNEHRPIVVEKKLINEVEIKKEIENKKEIAVKEKVLSPDEFIGKEFNERKIASEAEEQIVKPEIKNNFDQFYFLRLLPQVSWMKVTANSTSVYNTSNISALSKANLGLLGNFGIAVAKNLNIYGFTYLSQVNFYDESSLTISNKNFTREAFGIGFDYTFESKWRSSFRVGYFDEFFINVPSLNHVNIDIVQTPELHWGVRHGLGNIGNVIFDSGMFGKFIIPHTANSIVGKFGYGLGGDVLAIFKSKGLRIFYNYSDAKATNRNTSTFELGMNLIFESRFYE